MKKLLLTTVAAIALATSAQAAVVADLGVNPTSGTGHFSNGDLSGAFADQFTFELVGGPQFITIASATNVFTSSSDFITSFSGELFSSGADMAPGGGDDVGFGIIAATACAGDPDGCQILSGRRLLDAGSYFLNITGIGGGNAGYGGDLTTVQVPGPLAGAGLLPLLGAAAWFARRRRSLLAG